jgi:hypothetical protein
VAVYPSLVIGSLILASLLASLLATTRALIRRCWWMMAVAAALSLPITLAQIPYMVSWLLPCLQVAAAVALRWRVGIMGWGALLLAGAAVALVGGPGTILLDWRLGWILFAGPLVGFIALVWKRPPWVPRYRSDVVPRNEVL